MIFNLSNSVFDEYRAYELPFMSLPAEYKQVAYLINNGGSAIHDAYNITSGYDGWDSESGNYGYHQGGSSIINSGRTDRYYVASFSKLFKFVGKVTSGSIISGSNYREHTMAWDRDSFNVYRSGEGIVWYNSHSSVVYSGTNWNYGASTGVMPSGDITTLIVATGQTMVNIDGVDYQITSQSGTVNGGCDLGNYYYHDGYRYGGREVTHTIAQFNGLIFSYQWGTGYFVPCVRIADGKTGLFYKDVENSVLQFLPNTGNTEYGLGREISY